MDLALLGNDDCSPQSVRSALRLVAAAILYGGLAAAVVQSRGVVAVLAWWCMGWLLVGQGAVVHECVHRHLFRSWRCNAMVGRLAAVTVGFPFGAYSWYHRGHHAHPVSLSDPEGMPTRLTARWQYALAPVGGVGFVVLLWWRVFVGAAWLRRGRDRVVDGCQLIVQVAAALGVVHLWGADVLVRVWLVPWLLAVAVLAPLVLMVEHYGAELGDPNPLSHTRSVISNRLVRWVYWSNNLHAAHHAFPRVVPQRLQDAHAAVAGLQSVPPWKGYIAAHRWIWRSLRHDVDSASSD